MTETKARPAGVKRDRGRQLVGTGESCELRESPALYKDISGSENVAVRLQNEYYWENSV